MASHLYRTTDYGVTWTNVLSVALQGFFSLANLGNGILLAGTGITAANCRVYISTDSGVTWTLHQTFAGTSTHVVALAHLGGGSVLAGTGTTGQVWRTGVSAPALSTSQIVIVAQNKSGSTMLAGQPVTLGGISSDVPGAGADAAMYTSGGGAVIGNLGILLEDTLSNATGRVCVLGIATATAVSGNYAPGDLLGIYGDGLRVEVNNIIANNLKLGKVLVGGTSVTSVKVFVLPA